MLNRERVKIKRDLVILFFSPVSNTEPSKGPGTLLVILYFVWNGSELELKIDELDYFVRTT
jgi:hypothetical protein